MVLLRVFGARDVLQGLQYEDAVVTWPVQDYTPVRTSLEDLRRILKSGFRGQMDVSADGTLPHGWSLHHIAVSQDGQVRRGEPVRLDLSAQEQGLAEGVWVEKPQWAEPDVRADPFAAAVHTRAEQQQQQQQPPGSPHSATYTDPMASPMQMPPPHLQRQVSSIASTAAPAGAHTQHPYHHHYVRRLSDAGASDSASPPRAPPQVTMLLDVDTSPVDRVLARQAKRRALRRGRVCVADAGAVVDSSDEGSAASEASCASPELQPTAPPPARQAAVTLTDLTPRRGEGGLGHLGSSQPLHAAAGGGGSPPRISGGGYALPDPTPPSPPRASPRPHLLAESLPQFIQHPGMGVPAAAGTHTPARRGGGDRGNAALYVLEESPHDAAAYAGGDGAAPLPPPPPLPAHAPTKDATHSYDMFAASPPVPPGADEIDRFFETGVGVGGSRSSMRRDSAASSARAVPESARPVGSITGSERGGSMLDAGIPQGSSRLSGRPASSSSRGASVLQQQQQATPLDVDLALRTESSRLVPSVQGSTRHGSTTHGDPDASALGQLTQGSAANTMGHHYQAAAASVSRQSSSTALESQQQQQQQQHTLSAANSMMLHQETVADPDSYITAAAPGYPMRTLSNIHPAARGQTPIDGSVVSLPYESQHRTESGVGREEDEPAAEQLPVSRGGSGFDVQRVDTIGTHAHSRGHSHRVDSSVQASLLEHAGTDDSARSLASGHPQPLSAVLNSAHTASLQPADSNMGGYSVSERGSMAAVPQGSCGVGVHTAHTSASGGYSQSTEYREEEGWGEGVEEGDTTTYDDSPSPPSVDSSADVVDDFTVVATTLRSESASVAAAPVVSAGALLEQLLADPDISRDLQARRDGCGYIDPDAARDISDRILRRLTEGMHPSQKDDVLRMLSMYLMGGQPQPQPQQPSEPLPPHAISTIESTPRSQGLVTVGSASASASVPTWSEHPPPPVRITTPEAPRDAAAPGAGDSIWEVAAPPAPVLPRPASTRALVPGGGYEGGGGGGGYRTAPRVPLPLGAAAADPRRVMDPVFTPEVAPAQYGARHLKPAPAARDGIADAAPPVRTPIVVSHGGAALQTRSPPAPHANHARRRYDPPTPHGAEGPAVFASQQPPAAGGGFSAPEKVAVPAARPPAPAHTTGTGLPQHPSVSNRELQFDIMSLFATLDPTLVGDGGRGAAAPPPQPQSATHEPTPTELSGVFRPESQQQLLQQRASPLPVVHHATTAAAAAAAVAPPQEVRVNVRCGARTATASMSLPRGPNGPPVDYSSSNPPPPPSGEYDSDDDEPIVGSFSQPSI